MKRSIFLLSIFFFSLQCAYGQASLGIGSMTPFPATIRSGDTLKDLQVIVENTGNASLPLGTSITIMMSVNGSAGSVVGADSTTEALSPGDSVTIPINPINIVQPQYSIGGVNIIVVWPVANGVNTTDSLEREFYVHFALGMEEKGFDNFYKIFPVPVKDKLYLDVGQANSTLEEVRVMDVSGRTFINTRSNIIDVQALPPGVYILRSELSNGQVITRKFLKIQ